MVGSVGLVLVSHDGARWLPAVIEGIRSQSAPIAQVVAVDTNSVDESAGLLRDAFGAVEVLKGATGYPDAVKAGVARLDPEVEWIWLLHDDSNPAPTALVALLAAAESGRADIVGPKLREWPSLRRLLELGVTISGTGRRETGLERGEYDQGQHDDVRPVLAVNTAGLLIRRSAWEALGGLDARLPIFGNDVDLGWRAARAGLTTLIVPQAVVFHAEAAHRGARRTQLTGRHTHFAERRAALYTLLVNAPARWLPWQLVRLFLGTLLRALGFVAIRSLGEALDEVAALFSVYARPGAVLAGRRERRALDTGDRARVRHLLAPPWLPYRHGLDAVGDLAGALTNSAADLAERRRAVAAERDPASFAARNRAAAAEAEDDEALLRDSGAVARFLTNPVAVLLAVVVALLLVGGRDALGTVVGGGLAPTPAGVGAWWRLHLESWHPIGVGSSVPAPAYLLPLTLLGTVLTPGGAVSAVMLLAPLVALWGAWRLLRVVGRLLSIHGAPRWLILWGATVYALVPLVAGAWSDGRLGPVVSGAALPWLAHAALGFADPERDRRLRAGWRTGVLVALVTAFTPAAWLVCLLLTVVVLAGAVVLVPGMLKDRASWLPPVIALLVPVVLLAPWWLPLLLHGGGAGLLLDAGVPPLPAIDGAGLTLGRLPDLGAPWWLGLALPALAVLALVPARTRVPVLACWLVGLVAAVVALALSFVTFHLGALSTPAGTSFLLILAQGAAVVAVVTGAQGALGNAPTRGLTGWRRASAALVGVVAVVAPLGGLAWFVAGGHGALSDEQIKVVPAYMLQAAETGPEHGVLVLRGGVAEGVRYDIVRGDGTTLGEDEIAALTPRSARFDGLVRDFVSRPTDDTVSGLAAAGIQYVVQLPPADPTVAATIDAASGLAQASAATRATRAWQLDDDHLSALSFDAGGHRSWLRIVLLVVQLAGLPAALVLCVPTIERRRQRR